MLGKLKDRLAALNAERGPESHAYQDHLIAFLERIAQEDRRLRIGDMAQDFALPHQDGRIVRLSELLAQGPQILVFVRGDWCPYCAAQVAALSDAAADFAAAGIGLAIVSPEIGGRARKLAARHDVPFPVLCDVGMGVTLSYGLLFAVPEDTRAFLTSRGIDLGERSGTGAWFLPLTESYGIDMDGTIVAQFGGIDPRERPEPSEMLTEMRDALARRASSGDGQRA
ncbi:Putative peroxiredoxin/MT2597 [Roseivivax jejudonensis]|uniref:thioredoxin-dependent peroxiredoxin n=1 Tax=Roseivivax jejudonensis TaxID=1529041 RepID=A0A1X6Y4K4_9RHOB|nr:peroxiredoxin-like family protein [Roseivivax jejudonensis]SLN10412.1 Putative peroxiredoxin/MT2597 [Roseivivax jejudonensis]